jgi:hypothetical protein
MTEEKLIEALKEATENPVKDPAFCLYSLAMDLRSAADGSADPCCSSPAYYCALRDYLIARLKYWGVSGCSSEYHFRNFVECVIHEAQRNAPYLFEEEA